MDKEFSIELYRQNNITAMSIAVIYLLGLNKYKFDIHPLEQEEEYKKYDFYLLDSEDKKVYFEVERKLTWTVDHKWQGYPTLDIPYRKRYSQANGFIMVNKNLNTLALINMRDVLSSKVSSKRTKYTSNEKFFNVSLDKVKFVILNWINL